jgi:DNA-binding winged helix-turn-helix (wHTH) protein/TolB-like protein/Flp pilus assembly protein TadD
MSSSPPFYSFGPFVLDPSKRLLQRNGETVPLTPKAFDLLLLLVRHRGAVVAKEVLLDEVWPGTVVEESNLAFQIHTLRKALDPKSGGARYIATIPGRGYQFVTDVLTATEEREVVVEEHEKTTVAIHQSTTPRARVLAPIAAALVLLTLAGLLFLRRSPAATPRSDGTVRSLAVLPFKPIVAADRDEALEMGMADALIARISSVSGVVVRPLTAVRRYNGIDHDPLLAGRQLAVDAVMDGSIQRTGDAIRVRARLLRVADGTQLWSGEFDARYSGIFDVQDSISSRLAEALTLDLTPDERRRMTAHPTGNLDAYRAYALGRVHQLRVRPGDIREGIRYFREAVTLDPGYAAAYAGLADVYSTLPISADEPPAENFRQAKAAAEQALSLDPHLSDAYTARATAKFWYDWDWEDAERDFRRAIELNPGNGLARLRFAHLLSNLGRHEEARREALEAQKLEPLSPIVGALSAQFSLQAGNLAAAKEESERVLRDHPGFWIAHLNLAKALEQEGRLDESLAELERALKLSGPNLEAQSMIGFVHGRRGDAARARAIAAEMEASSRTRFVPPTKVALVYAGLDDRDAAFAWLRRACRERDLALTFLYANPRWQRLASDPRFEEIRRCVNLPVWRSAPQSPLPTSAAR